jgi:hypothetical protein
MTEGHSLAGLQGVPEIRFALKERVREALDRHEIAILPRVIMRESYGTRKSMSNQTRVRDTLAAGITVVDPPAADIAGKHREMKAAKAAPGTCPRNPILYTAP